LEKKAFNKKFEIIKEVDEDSSANKPKYNRLITHNNSPIRRNILKNIQDNVKVKNFFINKLF
jgi:hypothetical protein